MDHITAIACSDFGEGDMAVTCECGQVRPADKPHGYKAPGREVTVTYAKGGEVLEVAWREECTCTWAIGRIGFPGDHTRRRVLGRDCPIHVNQP